MPSIGLRRAAYVLSVTLLSVCACGPGGGAGDGGTGGACDRLASVSWEDGDVFRELTLVNWYLTRDRDRSAMLVSTETMGAVRVRVLEGGEWTDVGERPSPEPGPAYFDYGTVLANEDRVPFVLASVRAPDGLPAEPHVYEWDEGGRSGAFADVWPTGQHHTFGGTALALPGGSFLVVPSSADGPGWGLEWTGLGGWVGSTGFSADNPQLALAIDGESGTLYAFRTDARGRMKLISRPSGGAWEPWPLLAEWPGTNPAVAHDATTDLPVVAYDRTTGAESTQLTVVRLTAGSDYTELDGPYVGGGRRYLLEVDPADGHPLVLVLDEPVAAYRWDSGTAWTDLGFPVTASIDKAAWAFDLVGAKLTLAFTDPTQSDRVRVVQREGGSWVERGLATTAGAAGLALGFDPSDGSPLVASVAAGVLRVARWGAGDVWTAARSDVALPDLSPFLADNVGVALGRGPRGEIRLVSFPGAPDREGDVAAIVDLDSSPGRWADLGAPADFAFQLYSVPVADPIAAAFDAAGRPVLLGWSVASPSLLRVARHVGGREWEDLGTMPAVIDPPPQLVVANDDRPYVLVNAGGGPQDWHVFGWGSGNAWSEVSLPAGMTPNRIDRDWEGRLVAMTAPGPEDETRILQWSDTEGLVPWVRTTQAPYYTFGPGNVPYLFLTSMETSPSGTSYVFRVQGYAVLGDGPACDFGFALGAGNTSINRLSTLASDREILIVAATGGPVVSRRFVFP
ncbi:MAG: hypothetical protein HY905_28030 [Deltaproteobacteria bacterium]|nr:hypothetical protein [Deltaproteobacteria bacterium]